MENFLPIGSIVKVDETNKLYMITGYLPTVTGGVMKEYTALRYPLGMVSNKAFAFFNREDVKEVVHQGYEDKSFQALMEIMELGLKHKAEQQQEA